MQHRKFPDWNSYWAKYSNVSLLENKSSNLDETLQEIENEFQVKLLSGDHLLIISALEDRIEELTNQLSNLNSGIQADLFAK